MQSEKVDYLGAAIFWFYIVAALAFSAIVIYTITSLQPPKHGAQGRSQQVALFGWLAAISFGVLSGNMLYVLVQSFNNWSKDHTAALNDGLLPAIWRWSVTSRLFLDFGEAIVANSARSVWTQSALYMTMAVCMYMGFEGRQREVPRLYAFFALSQILPISFAQNLFYLALLRLPSRPRKAGAQSIITAVFLATYYLGVSLAPQFAGTSQLMPLIILARIALVVPGFLPTPTAGESGRNTHKQVQGAFAIISMTLVLGQVYNTSKEYTTGEIGKALVSHPAVSSLGCDFIISVGSFAAWTLTGGSTQKDRRKTSKKA